MAPKGNKNAVGNKGGRPSKFASLDRDKIAKLIKLGLTDKQLAAALDLCESTIHNYKKTPEFLQFLKDNKEVANAMVEHSLWERATGYEHPDTHISNYQGDITETPIIKHYAPDPTSMIFWLKNRRPEEWKDKTDVNIHHKVDEIEISVKKVK